MTTPTTTRRALAFVALALTVGCSAGGDEVSDAFDNNGYYGGVESNNQSPPVIPPTAPEETEDAYDFSQPVVLGDTIYVANESIDAVVAIDALSLSLTTLPVGFRPTDIEGPERPTEDSRVFVLNEGSDSVSILSPSGAATEEVAIAPGANRLVANPQSDAAIAWFDASADDIDEVGDLSSVTLIRGARAYRIAVGFRVSRVQWTEQGDHALVLSDDGVSTLDVAAIDADQIARPVPLFEDARAGLRAEDREVILDPRGRWAIARTLSMPTLTMTDLTTGQIDTVQLPALATDIDWVHAEGDALSVLVMMRSSRQLLQMSVPEGVRAAAMAIGAAPPPVDLDMGSAPDMSDAPDMADASDMGVGDDAGVADMGADPLEALDGVQIVSLREDVWLGAASVAPDGRRALLYTTVDEGIQIVTLYDLETHTLRPLTLEKGVRAVVAQPSGEHFVVFHDRAEAPDASGPVLDPNDPKYLAQRWGISIVDAEREVASLYLTESEPRAASWWEATDQTVDHLYVIFEPSARAEHDLLDVNLATLAATPLRLQSEPLTLGAVPQLDRVFVDQRHPLGRMTLVEVATGALHTITGYQLNAQID